MRTLRFSMALIVLLCVPIGCTPETEEVDPEAMETDTAGMVDAEADTATTMDAAGAGVQVYQQQPYGEYLVDGEEMSLYMFKADTQGADSSACHDACAEAWPPLTTERAPVAADPAVDEAMLGTIERQDGSTQVTYNGWPLYYFAQDNAPGDTQGQDVEGFGAEWYLVSPQGTEVHAEETTE